MPNQHMPQAVSFDLSFGTEVGLPNLGLLCLMTIKSWTDETAGTVQVAIELYSGVVYIRTGADDTWNGWIAK